MSSIRGVSEKKHVMQRIDLMFGQRMSETYGGHRDASNDIQDADDTHILKLKSTIVKKIIEQFMRFSTDSEF